MRITSLSIFVFQVFLTLKRLTLTRPSHLSVHLCMYVCVCVCVCVRACVSFHCQHIAETSEAIAIKFDRITASVTGIHHVLITLTDLNHENNKCSIALETASKAYLVVCEDSPTKGKYPFSV